IPAFDHARAMAAVRELLIAMGEDPDRDGLLETPRRVALAYAEMVSGLRQQPEEVLTTTFDLGHDELVLVKDIEERSLCEHHLAPFIGVAHLGYIPTEDGRITGLSKLPRGVAVLEVAPRCLSMGWVQKPGARPVPSAKRGMMRAPATRAEAMSLILGH